MKRTVMEIVVLLAIVLLLPTLASAHTVSKRDVQFVQANTGSAVAPFFNFQPNTRLAVLIFGLFHGFGLATKLQEFTLAQSGLVTNIVSFNVGVEIGQVLALTGVLIGLSYWRTRPGFLQHAFLTNTVLMVGGFILVGYQLTGYFVA